MEKSPSQDAFDNEINRLNNINEMIKSVFDEITTDDNAMMEYFNVHTREDLEKICIGKNYNFIPSHLKTLDKNTNSYIRSVYHLRNRIMDKLNY